MGRGEPAARRIRGRAGPSAALRVQGAPAVRGGLLSFLFQSSALIDFLFDDFVFQLVQDSVGAGGGGCISGPDLLRGAAC